MGMSPKGEPIAKIRVILPESAGMCKKRKRTDPALSERTGMPALSPSLSAVFPMVFTKNPFAHPDLQYRCNHCANIFKHSKHLSCIVRKKGLARHLDFLGFLSELNLFKRPCFALSFVSRPKANPSKAFQRLGKAAELAASSLDL